MFGDGGARNELEAAKREAEAVLPPGWRLWRTDYESYRGPNGMRVQTYSAAAEGPNGEGTLAVGLTETGAWRALARRLRGELVEDDGWAPPLPPPR